MIWDKLVDRCLLFTDAPGGLLKELLKESEIELANRLEIYDSLYNLKVPATTDGLGVHSHENSITMNRVEHNYHRLPHDYLRDVSVSHKGRKLKKISEEDIAKNQNGVSYSGTPTAYGITGDYIIFDTTPSSGDEFIIHYKATITENTTQKVLTLKHYDSGGPYVYLDTDLADDLNNLKIIFEAQTRILSDGNSLAYLHSSPGLLDPHNSNLSPANPSASASEGPTVAVGSRYTINSTFDAEGSIEPGIRYSSGALVFISEYRNVSPLIPDRFHKELCNYAIAVANAKSAPDVYDKYWTKWELNMDRLINEAQDRDLIHNIREEI